MARVLVLMILVGSLPLQTGCASDYQPLVVETIPANGATLVDPFVHPRVVFGSAATLDIQPEAQRKVVLYDVTNGGRITIEGDVTADDRTVTYTPTEPLPDGHDFQLEFKSSVVSGDLIDLVDASESPTEPVTWPFRLTFSTKTSPRVRAVYLEEERLTIRFSQPMNTVVTTKALHVAEVGGEQLVADTPVWATNLDVYLDLQTPLKPSAIYVLTVSERAIAENGMAFLGDAGRDSTDASEAWMVQFTGSQKVIYPRHKVPR